MKGMHVLDPNLSAIDPLIMDHDVHTITAPVSRRRATYSSTLSLKFRSRNPVCLLAAMAYVMIESTNLLCTFGVDIARRRVIKLCAPVHVRRGFVMPGNGFLVYQLTRDKPWQLVNLVQAGNSLCRQLRK